MHEVLHVPDTFQYITFDNMLVLHLVDRLVLSILALQSNKQKSAWRERVRERESEWEREREKDEATQISVRSMPLMIFIFIAVSEYINTDSTFIHRKNRYTTICIMKQNTRKKCAAFCYLYPARLCVHILRSDFSILMLCARFHRRRRRHHEASQ